MIDHGTTNSELTEIVLNSCVAYAIQLHESQKPFVASRSFDLMPEIEEMATQLYLAGAMWRYGEQYELPTDARTRGFVCLLAMLMARGVAYETARKRVALLKESSLTPDGQDVLAISAGYKASFGDGSLAEVLAVFAKDRMASGAPYRLLAAVKPVALIAVISGLLISKLLGSSWAAALGVASVAGVASIGIIVALHKQALQR